MLVMQNRALEARRPPLNHYYHYFQPHYMQKITFAANCNSNIYLFEQDIQFSCFRLTFSV